MTAEINISPGASALDSLRRVSRELADLKKGNEYALKGALCWGWHAVKLLAWLRLSPERESFDPWLQDYLHEGEQALETDRDARWQEREQLGLLELLDLLSLPELPILRPEFYQGWQDRTTRCQSLRRQMNELIGGGLTEEPREQLLLLLAAYHRLVRLPAQTILDTEEVVAAFPALFNMINMLVTGMPVDQEALAEALSKCRETHL